MIRYLNRLEILSISYVYAMRELWELFYLSIANIIMA
jgi:hypothetical protein